MYWVKLDLIKLLKLKLYYMKDAIYYRFICRKPEINVN